jgi:hypothetical protein
VICVVVVLEILNEVILGNVYTAVDAVDDADIPPELVATTENVYEVFTVNPDTVIGEEELVPVKPPGLLVAV